MLRGLVSDYVGYSFVDLPPGVHFGLPSTNITFIITFGVPLLAGSCADGPMDSYDVLLAGLHTAPTLIGHNGAMEGIQLDLSPFAVRQIFGLPASEIADQSIHLAQITDRLTSSLSERVALSATWEERFSAIDNILIAALDCAYTAKPEIIEAWRLVQHDPLNLDVGTLATHLGWSTRHLNGRFREEFGIAPKSALRISRFSVARRQVASGRPLAEVAAICGYADQSHLSRDFTQFTGHSPRQWLAQDILVDSSDSSNTAALA